MRIEQLSADVEPDEVWCAAASGTLARGLALAFPRARRHVVRVGRNFTSEEVAGAIAHEHPRVKKPNDLKTTALSKPPFPSCPHYDAKAWEICRRERGSGKVLFWNVTSPATQELVG